MVLKRIDSITRRIIERSRSRREPYLDRIAQMAQASPRMKLGCANQAHAFSVLNPREKLLMREGRVPVIGIVTSYNDMLSAHQPFARYPDLIKQGAREAGGIAQVAGGVPAMCDGVTQGEPGMELSLFSRDVIALSTAIALSHGVFDAAVLLGVCDKIVPGLVAGALSFGHLPALFIPAGPMTTGLANDEKTRIRQLHAEGKVDRATLLNAESASYHGPGTCTFYGTANTNQMLMEIMGLHLPGASFINPGHAMRDEITRAAARRALAITVNGSEYTPIGKVLDERAFVNGIVGLHATGGSTNHTMHMISMAKAAGIILSWDDLSDLADVTPLLCRIYPNGHADVNNFHAAGGTGFLIGEMLRAGLLHENVSTVWGKGLSRYVSEPAVEEDGTLRWKDAARISGSYDVLRPVNQPFALTGGLRVLDGNLGRAVIKLSAVQRERHVIEAPAVVFHTQESLQVAFKAGRLNRDMVAVVRFQGPKANGMPELHKLMPALGILQDRGFRVALVTDGRLSGASGKVPSAIHVTPEALSGGAIALVRDGDLIRVDGVAGTLQLLVSREELAKRDLAEEDLSTNRDSMGRDLFSAFRAAVGPADLGASVI